MGPSAYGSRAALVEIPGALGAAVERRGLGRVLLGVRPEDLILGEGRQIRATVSVSSRSATSDT